MPDYERPLGFMPHPWPEKGFDRVMPGWKPEDIRTQEIKKKVEMIKKQWVSDSERGNDENIRHILEG
ncbi:MAG: hypothetical protein GY854_19800 [Deltaproteobacteria bacterium]|nr:hypothetical protein [Deltaproteobacteria bacterium]